jgi:hypothetical protein
VIWGAGASSICCSDVGGYRFTDYAKRITLLDIIELLEDIGPRASDGAEALRGQDIGRALHMVLVENIARAALRSTLPKRCTAARN